MADPRKVYSSTDTQPVTLYAKKNVDDQSSHPLLAGAFGFPTPEYDEITLAYTDGKLTTVVYKMLTVAVMTLTLSYTSGKLTGVVKT